MVEAKQAFDTNSPWNYLLSAANAKGKANTAKKKIHVFHWTIKAYLHYIVGDVIEIQRFTTKFKYNKMHTFRFE